MRSCVVLLSSEKLGDKLGLTYHQSVNKDLAMALALDQNTADKVR